MSAPSNWTLETRAALEAFVNLSEDDLVAFAKDRARRAHLAIPQPCRPGWEENLRLFQRQAQIVAAAIAAGGDLPGPSESFQP